MSNTVISNAEYLRALQKLKPCHRAALLKTANSSTVRCICECVYNILQGKIRLNKTQLACLARHKKILRKLVKRGENWQKKKQILVQSGGAFLPFLLTPLLSGVLSSLFNKN